ncbi:MAG: aminopeptidase [Candidatus Aenigmatarchaeota archaeon]
MVSEKKMQRVARNMVRVNFGVKPKDVVSIAAGPKSLKFAEALAYECSMVGAQPHISYGSDELSLKIYKRIDPKFLKLWPKMAAHNLKVVDVEMVLDDSNPFVARRLPQKKIEIRRKAVKKFRDMRDRKLARKELRSALVGFPTRETAKAMRVPFAKLDRIFWDTMDTDFSGLYAFNERMRKLLRGAHTIRIVGDRTDLTFSVKGRDFINDCGMVAKEKIGYMNLPAGEIFTAPVETSANGDIYFDLPCMYHYGKQVEGVWFRFRKGKVVRYEIRKGKKDFEDIIKNASGAKTTIAELGIGTNPNARPTGGMIIVDEKLLGTVHIAIGQNKLYGGRNEATIHWDFFKTMGHGSRVYADGRVVMKDGKWLL